MSDTTLIGGPYEAPPWKVGDVVPCEYRDYDCVVVDFSDAPVPWPLGERHHCEHGQNRKRGIIVAGALIDAVRMEAALAVAHHWGVGLGVVRCWRRALGVDPLTEGTRRLKSAASASEMARKVESGVLWTPEVNEARAHATSAARTGIAPPHEIAWTPEDDAILLRVGARAAAPLIGRTLSACNARLHRLRHPGCDRARNKYAK
jgi:hypothetical protein